MSGSDREDVQRRREDLYRTIVVLVPATLILAWLAGLVVAALWASGQGYFEIRGGCVEGYFVVGAIFGALGGLVRGTHQVISNLYRLRVGIEVSLANTLVMKPLLFPIPGIAMGLLLASLFSDEGTSRIRVALLGIAGGVLWGPSQGCHCCRWGPPAPSLPSNPHFICQSCGMGSLSLTAAS